ncbi:MerR family transcriptional regulator [Kineococcus sp. GCM10028916]|uniref:MerR family transcriptional regulator n=1 Tax=Kineococcus sp. GCM10028916 TaxID=3273394 RepID=UPI0036450BAD
MTTPDAAGLGIREVSESTGLSVDTLRWYEKEGLLPHVGRSADGRRVYGPGAVRFVQLVQSLRRTGMPVAQVRTFVQLGPGTPGNSVVRLEVLLRQQELVAQRMAELRRDEEVLRRKVEDYRYLIANGLDCEGES